jgi:hypothetical protein
MCLLIVVNILGINCFRVVILTVLPVFYLDAVPVPDPYLLLNTRASLAEMISSAVQAGGFRGFE